MHGIPAVALVGFPHQHGLARPTAAQMEPERITVTQLSLFTNPHIIYVYGTSYLALHYSNFILTECADPFKNSHNYSSSLTQSNRYIITAKIKHTVPNQLWWYYACDECNKTLQPHGDKYKCTGPKCFGTTGGPRYYTVITHTHKDMAYFTL